MLLSEDAKALLKLILPIAIGYLATLALAIFVARWAGVF